MIYTSLEELFADHPEPPAQEFDWSKTDAKRAAESAAHEDADESDESDESDDEQDD